MHRIKQIIRIVKAQIANAIERRKLARAVTTIHDFGTRRSYSKPAIGMVQRPDGVWVKG